MKLQMRLHRAGCAQGRYVVKAKGCIMAVLSWADTCGRMPGWSPFAYVPVDPYGNGVFSFGGDRGIPEGATHVHDMAYAADLDNIDIIGMQCVISGKKFLFPEGQQLDWLEKHLEIRKDAAWHLILCHAPLLAHNPNRNEGTPYLDRNKRLQNIIDTTGNIIFVSGHTHISPNVAGGCVEYIPERNIIYLNSGSIVKTSMGTECGLMDLGWADGCITRIRISNTEIEICMRSVVDGLWFPRGYYRIQI